MTDVASVARGSLTTTGSTTVYTVPAGRVLLLKSLMVHNTGQIAGRFTWYVYSSPTIYVSPWNQQYDNTLSSYMFETWIAMNAGDYLSCWFNDSTLNYWVSGNLLPATASLANASPSVLELQPALEPAAR